MLAREVIDSIRALDDVSDKAGLVAKLTPFEGFLGQILLRRGSTQSSIYFLESGTTVSVLRDGSVTSVLQLQRDSEMVWEFVPGMLFGEENSVIEGQKEFPTDIIVSSSKASGFKIEFNELKEFLSPAILADIRIDAISRLVCSFCDIHSVPRQQVNESIRNQSHVMNLKCGQVLDVASIIRMYSLCDTILVSQGALGFAENDENIGKLEIGHSYSVRALQHLKVSALTSETSIIVTENFRMQVCTPTSQKARVQSGSVSPLSSKRKIENITFTIQQDSLVEYKKPNILTKPGWKKPGFNLDISCPPTSVAFFRSHMCSPKKRKTGLVLSLESLESLHILGIGAFGTVELVRHEISNSVFALKKIRTSTSLVNREVSIMGRLENHPFVTNLIRTFNDHENTFLLMEAGLCGDLFELVNQRPVQQLTNMEIRFLVPQLVLALEFMHRNNIIYRDVKPENVILCVDGYLKLTDFGMGKHLEDGARTYTLCGTTAFLAPEILVLGGYSKAVDWWGLGVLVFEIATGTFPFQNNNMSALRRCHKKFQSEYPECEIFEKLDSEISELVCILLNPDETKRHLLRTSSLLKNIDWVKVQNRDVTPPGSFLNCIASSQMLSVANQKASFYKPLFLEAPSPTCVY